MVKLFRQFSKAKCMPALSFGCTPGTQRFWTINGCRGSFECADKPGRTTCETLRCPCGGFREPLNRTLVCTIGSIRGGSFAAQSLARNLLLPLSADLAVLVSYSARLDSPLLRWATHVWRIPEYSDWEVLVNETISRYDSDWLRHTGKAAVRYTPNLWGPLAGKPGSGAIVSTLRLVLLNFLDATVGGMYRTLILTRTDLVYACAHPVIQPDVGEIFVQQGEDNGADGHTGLSDRHMVFHFADRRRVLEVLPWLVKNHPQSLYAPEIILGMYFEAQNLTIFRFQRVNFAVKEKGVDATRWNFGAKGSLPCGHGYLAKYATEHALAIATCRLDPCAGRINVTTKKN